MYKEGLKTQNKEINIENLVVEGEIPLWLNGNLLRNGPGKFEYGKNKLNHWFDGAAMINNFSFESGKVSYQNKFVKSNTYINSTKKGKLTAMEYGTDYRTFWNKFLPPRISDNPNVNFLKLKNKILTTTVTPAKYEIDKKNTNTVKKFTFKGNEKKLNILTETPHPSLDTTTGDIYNIGSNFIKKEYIFYKISKGTNERKLVAKVKTKNVADIHSFSTTKNYMILIEIPWFIKILKLILGNTYFNSIKWEKKYGVNFIIVNKKTGEVQKIHYEKSFDFIHSTNAFEKDGRIILDLPCYSTSVMKKFLMKNLLNKGYNIDKYEGFFRFNIDLKNNIVERKKITNTYIELQTINYSQYNEKNYSYIYSPSQSKDSSFFDRLVKINLTTGEEKEWYLENTFPGEPIFVAKPDSTSEDDGLLLTVFLDGKTKKSFLLIIDAKSFTQIAKVKLPQHIPFGFHGTFYKNK